MHWTTTYNVRDFGLGYVGSAAWRTQHAIRTLWLGCALIALPPCGIRMIALASKAYHALKFVHMDEICRAASSNSFGPMQALLADVARHFARDMGMI